MHHLRDHLSHDAPDLEVKQLAVARGYVVVTKDTTFMPISRWQKTYLEQHVSAVILGGKLASNATLAELEEWFLTHWHQIEATLEAAPNPTVVRAYADGRLELESEVE